MMPMNPRRQARMQPQPVVGGGPQVSPMPTGPAPIVGGGPMVSPTPTAPAPVPGGKPMVSPMPTGPVLGGGPMVSPKPMKKGGTVSASKRADGIAQRGKTKGRMC